MKDITKLPSLYEWISPERKGKQYLICISLLLRDDDSMTHPCIFTGSWIATAALCWLFHLVFLLIFRSLFFFFNIWRILGLSHMYFIFFSQLSLSFFYTLFLLWKNGNFICNHITILFLLGEQSYNLLSLEGTVLIYFLI